ncbi:MAG: peptidoglycan endopeptidase [Treponema sp.]|nr:peptidoglycan endopeptidase [Treponema sp.]
MRIKTTFFKSIVSVRFTVMAFVLLLAFSAPLSPAEGGDISRLAAFSDPGRIWGSGVERVLEEAYRLFFQTRIIEGRVMNLRIPFAMNYERDTLTEEPWGFVGGGKASPAFLWERINTLLDSEDFRKYTEALSSGREKVIIFDLPSQTWTVSLDPFDIARMRAGFYQGLPHRPHVLHSGRGVDEADVYNFLFGVGLLGIDCSGFVWHVLSHVAAAGGIDLGRTLAAALGARAGQDPAWFAGTSFFNSRSPHVIPVHDEIRNLRPADILLFRSGDGGMGHAAVIQSIDFSAGVIRYLQCTDEAPWAQRGVHDSFIYFDPAFPNVSLSDPSLVWTKQRYPPFPGERASPFTNDGDRFRAFAEHGGGRVVRLRAVSQAIERINSGGVR